MEHDRHEVEAKTEDESYPDNAKRIVNEDRIETHQKGFC